MAIDAEIITLIDQSRANRKNNNVDMALQLLQKAKDLARSSPELQSRVYFEMAKNYSCLNRDEEAADFVKKALELDPNLQKEAGVWVAILKKNGKNILSEKITVIKKGYDKNPTHSHIDKPEKVIMIAKPGKITAIGGMRLGSGICNIIAGAIFFWWVLPIVLIPFGIIEIVSASNLLKSSPNRTSNTRAIPILEIIAILTLAGWISVIVGIVSLAFLSDQQVREYFKKL